MILSLHIWLIPLLPLAGFLLNGILGSRLPRWLVSTIGLLAPFLSFVLVLNAYALTSYSAVALPYVETFPHPWIAIGGLRADFSFFLDPLSLVMLLVVTGVGFLIHIYSVGYMAHEEGYARYFSFLNLFLFFMTVLVLAGNVLLLFVGWEGVGLASYLLIGFWFQKPSAAAAGKKAFIVNRIGDFGFLIGIFLILANFGTLNFAQIAQVLTLKAAWHGGVLTAICLCLLVGAAGKSAQLPLYVWLPDAMEGPTPVSALIHAATMVTAGVYMIARTHFLFDRAPIALAIVAIVGAATAIFAATIALAQTDIKRVLAYSTISQLGYMFLACGVAAYSAAIFHLVTHAFFKALLFLAAGSVIHAMGGEQDMRKMGGLRKKIPVTFWTMTIAVFTIAGFPPLAAFFSKDAILYAAFVSGSGGVFLWLVGLLTALLTSLYMFRLWYMTFFGELRTADAHPHESPRSMRAPLIILALLSICGGWIGIESFSAYLAPSVGLHPAVSSFPHLELILTAFAVLAALEGWLIADKYYRRKTERPAQLAAALPAGYTLLANKYYVDEIYDAVLVKPLFNFSRYFLGWVVDTGILGGIAWLLAGSANLSGAILQRWQSGNLRSYAAWLTAAAAVILLFVFHASIGSYLGARGIDVQLNLHWMGH
ncbi:MAG: NADH-quinone oxidoreductase subunit L [Terracidiphilus sp.]|nr:NADH-quinone oxidoreductase subunit L [Terracidiphilus sp.]MDR3796546.1 NADH-quinone oxidoreductase subunit L [Terracidiphilus sp.]